MSRGTRGELPFYCAFHFNCADPIEGIELVRQSAQWDGQHESYLELRRMFNAKNKHRSAQA